jgi:molybdopterin-guanine dinucleotide biosynthesis protein A
LPVFPDRVAGQGALGGLYSALSVSAHPYVVAVACDMPFVNARLLLAQLKLAQASEVDVVIPATPDGLEPLHAVYRRETCLTLVEQALAAGERRMTGWLERAKVRVVSPEETAEYDPRGLAFINLNKPEDLAQAEAM